MQNSRVLAPGNRIKQTTMNLFVACLVLIISPICAQYDNYNLQQQYQGYNPQQQYQQPQYIQQQQPQPTYQQYQQHPQQYQVQPQQQQYQPPAEKIGYEAQDIVPAGKSPLKNLDEAQGNPKYVDFINQLYRKDHTKPALQHHSRQRRAIIFRPMFVYRQQKLRKERISGQKSTTPAPKTKSEVPANQSQLYKDKENHVYREYNSFYDPYRYGQRFPYRP